MSYLTQPFTEAQAQSIDERTTVQGPTMGQMAKKPATRAAIIVARDARSDGYWNWLCHNSNRICDADVATIRPVWDTMPGSTCMMDALRLIAFARITD